MLKIKDSSLLQTDNFVSSILKIAASVSAVIVILILGFLIRETADVPSRIGITSFFFDKTWNPTESQFNLIPMLAGSLLSTLGAVMLAIPTGVVCAVFLHLYANDPLRFILRRTLEILGGIPSVVYGFWGLVVLVPMINMWYPPGAGLSAAVSVLTIMILPTASLMIDAAFQAIPRQAVAGVRALGLERWEILTLCLIPQARLGILTATLLSVGRAIGETMAVLMVCGNIVQFPSSIFDPIRTLTANIALELGYAEGNHRSALYVSGILLLFIIAVLIVVISIYERQHQRAKYDSK